MAVTITSADLSVGGVVVETSGGVKYAVFVDSNLLVVYKDIDSTPILVDSAANTDITGNTGTIGPIHAAIDSSDNIHLICASPVEKTWDVNYAILDTGTGTISTWEEAASYTEGDPANPGASIAIDSNDKPHVLFVDPTKITGSIQDNVYYTEKTGASWSTPEQVGARATKTDSYNNPKISMCPNDDVEALYYFVTDGDVAYRRKNAAWNTEAVYAETSATIGAVTVTSGDTVYRYHADDAEDIEENDVDTTYNTHATNAAVSAALVSTDRYIFYIDTSSDVHVISNAGSGWTDESAQQTGTYLRVIAEWAYNNENQSGEINYIFDDGTNVYYDSFSLGADISFSATCAATTTTPDTAVIDCPINFQATITTRTTTTITEEWWDPDAQNLSVWSAYSPEGAASLAASYIDLSGENHDAGVGVAPTWDAVNGWILNGSTQYLTTAFVPQDDQSQTMIIQFTDVAGTATMAGARSGATRCFEIEPNVGGQVRYRNGSLASGTPSLLAGNVCVSGAHGYRNGVVDTGPIGSYADTITHAVYIGCVNNEGIAAYFLSCYIKALALYDGTLTADQVWSIAAAMAGVGGSQATLSVSYEMSANLAAETTTPGTIPTNWWDPDNEGLSVWSAYQPKDAASLAASYTDLSGENHDAGVGVAPTWDAADGWIFNGSTQYLTTTFFPQTDQSQTALIQYTHAVFTDGDVLFGMYHSATRGFLLQMLTSAGNKYRSFNGGHLVSTSAFATAANAAIGGDKLYINGVPEPGIMGAWVGDPAVESVAIGGRAGLLFSQSHFQAFAIYDATLTSTQVAKVAAAMGRAVGSSLSVSREMSATISARTTTIGTLPSTWWDPNSESLSVLAAYASQDAASLAASYVNLANPGTYNLTLGVTPDWDAVDGWGFTGTQYMKTGIVPASGYSAVIQYSDFTVIGNKFFLGELQANATLILGKGGEVGKLAYWNGGQLQVGPEAESGNMAVAGQTGYFNGIAKAGTIPDFSSSTTEEIYIGGYNNNDAMLGCATFKGSAVAIYDCILTADQMNAIAAAMGGAGGSQVTLSVSYGLDAILASATTTPDTATLEKIVKFLASLVSATTTPDNAILSVTAIVEFLASLVSATTTPDVASLAVVRELLAVLASATTTPDDAMLGLAYELVASLASATTTPDTPLLRLSLEFLAALASDTTTPDDAALALVRELSALAASATTTPDIVALAVSRAFDAIAASATTTTDIATLKVVRELIAILAADTTTPDTVVLSVAVIVEFLASLVSATTTPDVVSLAVVRELVAALASATTTPDAAITVVRELLAVLASTTTAPDDVILGLAYELVAAAASATTTPDTALLSLSLEFLAALDSATTTPDTAVLSISVIVEFLASLVSVTTTPDVVPLAVVRELVAALASATTTPDTVMLGLAYELIAVLASATTTPDTPLLKLSLEFLAALDSTTTTPDDVILGLAYEFLAVLASATTTPDTASLKIIVSFLATLASSTSTPDTVLLALSKALSALLASATTTPDTVVLSLAGIIQFLATLASVTVTPDLVALTVVRELVAAIASSTLTPSAQIAVVREMAAALASITLTPDAVLELALEFAAGLDSATTTPDDVALALSLEFLSAVAASTVTPDTVMLSLAYELAAALASATTTPDTGALSLAISFLSTVATSSTTPDTITLAVARDLVAALASVTTTPDTTLLALSKALTAVLASATTTPDTVVLSLAGLIEFLATISAVTVTPEAALTLVLEFAAGLDSVSVTPDSAILGLSLELLAAAASATTTPDSTVLGLAYDLAAALASATTTPDDATLSVAVSVYFSAILAALTATPDDALLGVAKALAAIVDTATTTPTVTLAVLRDLVAAAGALTTTPDNAVLSMALEFLGVLSSATTTPDDVHMTLGIGEIILLAALLAAATSTATIPWGLARGAGGPVGLDVQVPEDYMIMFGDFGAVQLH